MCGLGISASPPTGQGWLWQGSCPSGAEGERIGPAGSGRIAGSVPTAKEMFQEEGTFYTSHLWIAGIVLILAFECSFTVVKGQPVDEASRSLLRCRVRREGEKYPAEVIPVRLSEIYQINESYEWVSSLVKDELKTDFQGTEDDLKHLQQVIDSGKIGPKKRRRMAGCRHHGMYDTCQRTGRHGVENTCRRQP